MHVSPPKKKFGDRPVLFLLLAAHGACPNLSRGTYVVPPPRVECVRFISWPPFQLVLLFYIQQCTEERWMYVRQINTCISTGDPAVFVKPKFRFNEDKEGTRNQNVARWCSAAKRRPC